jgi:hypothetical protein
LLAALAIVYAIRHAPRAEERERQPLRLRIRPVLTGRLGQLMVGVSAFEFGNVAATLLILRASELLAPGRSQDRATQLALGLYIAYNVAATVASIPAGRLGDRRSAVLGQHFAGLLEVSLLVGEETVPDEQGAYLLNTWQEASELGLRQIGPYFGLNRDYDEFIIGAAPLLFAVAAVMCRNQWQTKAWIAHELDALIRGEDDAGVQAPYTSAARLWLLHLAASTLRDLSSTPDGNHNIEYELVEIFQRAPTSVFLAKVPLDLLLSPPSPQELVGEDAEPLPIGELSGAGRQIDHPEWTDLSNGYFPEIGQDGWSAGERMTVWRDTFGLAIAMLLDEDWIA